MINIKKLLQPAAMLFALLGITSYGLAQSLPPLPPMPAGRIDDVWLFQDTNWTSLMGNTPISFTNLSLTSDWAGNGLLMDSTNAASLNYAVIETNGATNVNFTKGTIEMWFSPDWNTSDGIGNWGTLLEAGSWNTNLSAATGAIGLYISPDGSTINWSAQTNGYSTNYLCAPINWNAGDFHHIAVTYSATNSALYLEGQLITNGTGITVLPTSSVLSNGFSIGSDGNNSGLRQARGIFNQLITYDYALDAETISNYFAYDSQNVFPLPSSGHFTADDSPPSPGGGSSGGSPSFYSPTYGSNDFWIEALPLGTNSYNADTNSITLLLHATIADTAYQLFSTTSLQGSNTIWVVETNLIGSEITNFTAIAISMTGRPGLFFRALAYGLDSDGDGLPDWWEQRYSASGFPLSYTNSDTGNTGIPDGYKQDSAGDGYNNFQKYQMGIPPNVFVTPAAPSGFSVTLDTNNMIRVNWNQASDLPSYGGGAVTGYTLSLYGTNISLAAGVTNFTVNTNDFPFLSDYLANYYYYLSASIGPQISLQVNYANTNSASLTSTPLENSSSDIYASIARGQSNTLYLVASAIPPNIAFIRLMINPHGNYWAYPNLYNYDYVFELNIQGYSPPGPTLDIPVSYFTNGIYQIPAESVPIYGSYQFYLQGISATGVLGLVNNPNVFQNNNYDFIPFIDGRTQIQQNIKFLLRSATSDLPFSYGVNGDLYGYTDGVGYYPSSNYVTSGLFTSDAFDGYKWNEFQPFDENYFFANWLYSTNNFVGGGYFITGVFYTGGIYSAAPYELGDTVPEYLFPIFSYATNALQTPAPTQLDDSAARWIYHGNVDGSASNVGLNLSGANYTVSYTCANVFGLSLYSLLYTTNDSSAYALAFPGQNIATNQSGNLFFEFVNPVLSTSDYYFGRSKIDPIPGDGVFDITNTTSSLLMIPFGQPSFISAWAKQSILNGASGKYAYPEQYFDKAFLSDTNGNISTNETGIVSEFGNFFPTQAGKVFLTTKADGQTGSTGQCPVYVVKLQLDVNHDGIMDTSFSGPDNTSVNHPFVFWVNNDCDYSSGPTNPGKDIDNTNTPDYALQNIPSMRDLEDWARLWICGLPTLPTNCQATLSWNVLTGSPAINLVRSFDTNGGTGYLTDTNIAAEQSGGVGGSTSSFKIANITPSESYTFNPYFLTGDRTNCFLFEGAGIGKGELVLTISQNGTNILTTSTFLDLHDIKDLYERVYTTNYDTEPPSSKVSNFAMEYSLSDDGLTDANFVVFIHGLNTGIFAYYNDGETMFKRLYWQGYAGKYATFRWPSPVFSFFQTSPDQISYLGFNSGEYISWHSGSALKGYLDSLTNRFPGFVLNIAVHSLGNVAANEAIREGAIVDNYALMQAAISAWAFDGDNTNLIYDFLATNSSTSPNSSTLGGYQNCFTNVTRRANFYNDDDFALFEGVIGVFTKHTWEGNQLGYKPDVFTYPNGVSYTYSFDGVNCSFLQTDAGFVITNRTIAEDFEKKAFVARSRTKAVGAAGLAHDPNALTGGTITTNVSLQNTSLGFVGGAAFGNTRDDHSGEFAKPIQNAVPFYFQLMKVGFQIQPQLSP